MKKSDKKCSNEFENEYWPKGKLILGIDEAGRGPLAGPLTVAGVIFPIGYQNDEIYDSKSISEKKRDELFEIIKKEALWYKIVEVTPQEIDKYNIYRADQRAFKMIADESSADIVLTDAMPIEIDRPSFPIVKGDRKSVSIAAASILSKVTRDRIMKEYDSIYPQYGFAKHKGYPTKAHMEAIKEYGITPIHRRSFSPVAVQQEKLNLFDE